VVLLGGGSRQKIDTSPAAVRFARNKKTLCLKETTDIGKEEFRKAGYPTVSKFSKLEKEKAGIAGKRLRRRTDGENGRVRA